MTYITKQRKMLLDILEKHCDETLSADQIASYINDKSVSRSAIYRNLQFLETEGKIKRISVQGSNRVFYRYCDGEECREHIHLSCSSCGKTFHLDMNSTDSLVSSVIKGSDFEIDRQSTVLYGLCKECRSSRKDSL